MVFGSRLIKVLAFVLIISIALLLVYILVNVSIASISYSTPTNLLKILDDCENAYDDWKSDYGSLEVYGKDIDQEVNRFRKI